MHLVLQGGGGLVAVGGVPDAGLGGGDGGSQGAYCQAEVAFLEYPLVVIVDIGEVVGRELEGDGLGLAGASSILSKARRRRTSGEVVAMMSLE